jgi:hypothetical protein
VREWAFLGWMVLCWARHGWTVLNCTVRAWPDRNLSIFLLPTSYCQGPMYYVLCTGIL